MSISAQIPTQSTPISSSNVVLRSPSVEHPIDLSKTEIVGTLSLEPPATSAVTLDSVSDQEQLVLLKNLSESKQELDSELIDQMIKVVGKTKDRQIVDQIVLLLKDIDGQEIEGVMRECFRLGRADSFAEGHAIAYLLEKYPSDKEIRKELALRLDASGVVASQFANGLIESQVPAVMAMVLDQVAQDGGIGFLPKQALEWTKSIASNVFSLDQTKRDLSTIIYHLCGEHVFTDSKAVLGSLLTLVESGNKNAIRFVENQMLESIDKKLVPVITEALEKSRE
jgi:hypothetical protein